MSCKLTANIGDIYSIVKSKLMEYDFDNYQSSILYVESPNHSWDYKSIFVGFDRNANEHKLILRFWEYSNFIEPAKIGVYKPAFIRINEKQILLNPKEVDKIKNFITSIKPLNPKGESDHMEYLLNVMSENHKEKYQWNSLKPEWNNIGFLQDYLSKLIKK